MWDAEETTGVVFNGEIYNARAAAARARGEGAPVPDGPQRHRGPGSRLQGVGLRALRPPQRDVRVRDLGPAAPPPRRGSRPRREEAALRVALRRGVRARVRDQDRPAVPRRLAVPSTSPASSSTSPLTTSWGPGRSSRARRRSRRPLRRGHPGQLPGQALLVARSTAGGRLDPRQRRRTRPAAGPSRPAAHGRRRAGGAVPQRRARLDDHRLLHAPPQLGRALVLDRVRRGRLRRVRTTRSSRRGRSGRATTPS